MNRTLLTLAAAAAVLTGVFSAPLTAAAEKIAALLF